MTSSSTFLNSNPYLFVIILIGLLTVNITVYIFNPLHLKNLRQKLLTIKKIFLLFSLLMINLLTNLLPKGLDQCHLDLNLRQSSSRDVSNLDRMLKIIAFSRWVGDICECWGPGPEFFVDELLGPHVSGAVQDAVSRIITYSLACLACVIFFLPNSSEMTPEFT
jgi:hypothetical protein